MNLQFESENLFAGADWSFTESLSDYPASEYSLDIIIKKSVDDAVVLTGVADADDFNFSKTEEETTAIGFGDFKFQAKAVRKLDSKVFIIKSGTKTIHPLLSVFDDTRTYWEKIRDEAKECYDKLAQLTATEVNFKGKVIKYAERGKLLEQINIAEIKIQEEIESQSGELTGPKIFKARIK